MHMVSLGLNYLRTEMNRLTVVPRKIEAFVHFRGHWSNLCRRSIITSRWISPRPLHQPHWHSDVSEGKRA